MSLDNLARFLESLSPNKDEAERLYIRLREKKLVGFFSMKGISDPEEAAAEVLDRAALRISSGANVPDVEKYCLGIARNVAKEWWRSEQKEKSGFLLFTQSLTDNSSEEIERIQRLLKPCFEELGEEDQKLLLAYCKYLRGQPRAEHRRRLAEAMKTTLLALRLRVTRLRTRLTDCVRKRTENS